MITRLNPVERFKQKVFVNAEGCHLWQSTVKRDGYGQFWLGKPTPAHQVAYRLFVGEILAGMCVLHKCDVKTCVNPEHLFLGTLQDNVRDMDAKGRRRTRAKLGAEAVKRVKELLGSMSQERIAKAAGIDQTTVSRIKRGVVSAYRNT